jgi:hypothetical protein
LQEYTDSPENISTFNWQLVSLFLEQYLGVGTTRLCQHIRENTPTVRVSGLCGVIELNRVMIRYESVMQRHY